MTLAPAQGAGAGRAGKAGHLPTGYRAGVKYIDHPLAAGLAGLPGAQED